MKPPKPSAPRVAVLAQRQRAETNPRGAGRKSKGRQNAGLSLSPEIIAIINHCAAAIGGSRNDAAEKLILAGRGALESTPGG